MIQDGEMIRAECQVIQDGEMIRAECQVIQDGEMIRAQGSHGSGKSQGKFYFLKVRENFISSRSGKSQGILKLVSEF